jgi:ABC-2 type transport system permease protein
VKKVGIVLQKELQEIVKNRLLLFSLVPLPLVLVVIPLAFVFFARGQPIDPEEAAMYRRLSPAFAAMDPTDVFQIILVGQFMFMLLLTPVIAPLTIATFSIIGEKQVRSLEPLLATPVRTWELLAGKVLAALIPAVLATWVSYLVLIVGMGAMASPAVFATVVSPMWMLAIVLLAPLLAVLAINLGVLVSSRVNDTRVAQQVSALLVLPLVGLGIAQTAGVILYDLGMFVVALVLIAALNALVMVATVRLFQRETILTRWK